MTGYQPIMSSRVRVMGQDAGAAPESAPAVTPAPAPAVIATEYSGVPGFLETVAVLGVSAAAAYVGIRTGRTKNNSKTIRTAGWIGGVGGALIGLLYLGSKTGVSQMAFLPQVRIVPS